MTSSRISLNLRRVAKLAAQGYSHRWIAERLGINRAAIPEILRRWQLEQAGTTDGNGDPPGFDLANLRRCAGCGALVYLWPCLACCHDHTSPTADHSTSA